MTNTAGYAALSHDRKLHERATAVKKWLGSPLARFVLPKGKRAEVEALIEHLTQRLAYVPPVEHLSFPPSVGWPVRLLHDSLFLREIHGATTGSVGIVVAHSQLHPDDNGVLVDWGNGDAVRCDLFELALEQSALIGA